MNLKNYLEQNGIYEHNEEILNFLESNKDIEKRKKLNFILLILIICSVIAIFLSKFNYEELIAFFTLVIGISIVIVNQKIIDLKRKIFKDFEIITKNGDNKFTEIYNFNRKKREHLEVYIKTNNDFGIFDIRSERGLKYFLLFLILLALDFFIIIFIISYNDVGVRIFLSFLSFIISLSFFYSLKEYLKYKSKTGNKEFDKKFVIKPITKISTELQEKILEINKIIKNDFTMSFYGENIYIRTILIYFTFNIKKELLINYIIFKKCEKVFEK